MFANKMSEDLTAISIHYWEDITIVFILEPRRSHREVCI
jgi:hypothetical protein